MIMNDSTAASKSQSAQAALVRVATNEIGQAPAKKDENGSKSSHEIAKDDEETVSDEVAAQPEKPTSTNEKTKLQDQTNLLPLKQLLVVFAGCSCALFCSLLDQTIVSTALPTLGRVFNDAAISSWVGTAYLLTSTACQPLYGRLSDIFGRKVILLASLALFLLGSILCAVAQSMVMLIVFRAVAGIGGGGILTCVMIVIADVVSLQKRGTYNGILGVVVALANSIGPLIGGVFTEKASWRWCFYINIPLTSIAILVVIFVLPLKRVKGNAKEKLKKIDYTGCVLMLASAVLILVPLSWGGTKYAWDSAGVIAPLVLGIVLLIAFILVEMKVAALPLVPMHIFKNPTVAGASAGAFFTGFVFYCNLYYLPQFYQVVRQSSPIQSGILIIPLILTQTITSFTSGFIVSRTGNYTILLWSGFLIWTIACGLFTTISPTTSDARLIGYQILSGFGAGQTFQTNLIAIQNCVERRDMAVATGMRNFVRLLGGTVALAACAAILNNTVKMDLGSLVTTDVVESILADPTTIGVNTLKLSDAQSEAAVQAYVHGIHNIYYFMTPLCGISFVLTILLVKQKSLKRDDDAKMEREGKEWAERHRGLQGLGRKHTKEDEGEKVEDGNDGTGQGDEERDAVEEDMTREGSGRVGEKEEKA